MKHFATKCSAMASIVLTLVALGTPPALADGVSTTTDRHHGSHTVYTTVNRHLTVYDVYTDGYGGYTRMIYASDATGTCVDYAGANTSNLCVQTGYPSGLFGFYDCLENNHGATIFNCAGYTWDKLP